VVYGKTAPLLPFNGGLHNPMLVAGCLAVKPPSSATQPITKLSAVLCTLVLWSLLQAFSSAYQTVATLIGDS
jgi:hypothetical protein